MQFKKILFLASLILICFTSCEKLLDKEPYDSLSIEETFKDLSGTKTALAGAYSSLLETFQPDIMVYPDLIGGNIKYGVSSRSRLEDVYNFIQVADNCSMNSSYLSLYSALNNVNNIIKYAALLTDATTAQKNRVLAEARCLRALLHFNLVRLYARPYNHTADSSHLGIVVNTQPLLVSDPLPVRSTIDATYDAIETDLLTALQLFNNTTAALTGGYAANYWNNYSAAALLSKVYLYKGNWQRAWHYANIVITTNNYQLLTNAAYVNSWGLKTPSTESVFEIAIEAAYSGTSLGAYYGSMSNTYQQFAATEDLLSLYSATDIRGRASLFNASGNTYFTRKYEKDASATTPIKLMRLSEVYLIRAEAAAELDMTQQANEDLEVIRKRADVAATPLALTGTALKEAIQTERRKELAFEGNLLFDLTRHKKGVSRTDCTAQVCGVAYTDFRLLLPLPKASVNVNPQLIQNDNY
ncbi:hypothetical protein HNQ91_000820 [Filimonas zeae]|nr:RagB/SusD family nutrient uptake outer membrane protein [Filimonas zeae]MDR6337798.1 hypothetical protein [Filimonas zeae]